jgi:adenosylmethionine-8-amino-7-oxononanoate aminotransferase
MHGPTFMGNAVAAAVALRSIEIFERDNYLDKIRRIEVQLRRELLPIRGAGVKETRVLGAVGVIEVTSPAAHQGLQAFAAERGVWLRPFDRTVYTAPPYVISECELSQVTAVMRDWFSRS